MMDAGLRRVEPWRAAYSVRRDWPDGTHEFVGLRISAKAAANFLARDRRFWRRAPMRPTHGVVEISIRDFDLHAARRGCRAPDCPSAVAAARPEEARA